MNQLKKDVEHAYVMAATGGVEDFLFLLRMEDELVCDIRQPVNNKSLSTEERMAASAILNQIIDKIGRVRKDATRTPIGTDRDGLD